MITSSYELNCGGKIVRRGKMKRLKFKNQSKPLPLWLQTIRNCYKEIRRRLFEAAVLKMNSEIVLVLVAT